MYPVFAEPYSTCEDLGFCAEGRSFLGEYTCDECISSVQLFGVRFGSEEMVIEIMTFLKVPDFIINILLYFHHFHITFFRVMPSVLHRMIPKNA